MKLVCSIEQIGKDKTYKNPKITSEKKDKKSRIVSTS